MRKILSSRLFRSTMIYWLSAGISASLSFLLLPVLTRALSPEEYGVIGLFTIAHAFLTRCLGLGMTTAVSREYYARSAADTRVLATTIVWFFALGGALISGICALAAEPLARMTGIPTIWMATLAGAATLALIGDTCNTLQRARDKAWHFAALTLLGATVNLVLSLILVVYAHMGYAGRLTGMIAGLAATCLFGLADMKASGLLGRRVDFRLLVAVGGFGLPMVAYSLFDWAIAQANRFVLNSNIGLEAVGILTVAMSIGNAVAIVHQGLANSLTPWIMRELAKGEERGRRRIGQLTFLIDLGGIAGIGAAYLIFHAIFFVLVDKKFAASLELLPWIMLAQYAFTTFRTRFPILIFFKATKTLATLSGFTAAVALAATVLLVEHEGIIGAAQALALGYLLRTALMAGVAHHLAPLPYFPWTWNRPLPASGPKRFIPPDRP